MGNLGCDLANLGSDEAATDWDYSDPIAVVAANLDCLDCASSTFH